MNDKNPECQKNYLDTNIRVLVGLIVGLSMAYKIPLDNIFTVILKISFIIFSFFFAYKAAWPFAFKLIEKLLSIKFFYFLCTVIGIILSLIIPPLAQNICIHDIQVLTQLPVEYFPHAQSFLTAVYIVGLWAAFFIFLVPFFAFLIISTGALDKMIYQTNKKHTFLEYVLNLFTGPYPRTYILLSLIGLACTLSQVQDIIPRLPSFYSSLRSLISSMDLTWNVSCDHYYLYPGIRINTQTDGSFFVVYDDNKFFIKKDCKYISPIS